MTRTPRRTRRLALIAAPLAIASLLPAALPSSALAAIGPMLPDGGSRVAGAAPTDAKIALQLVTAGLSKPLFAIAAPDGSGRLFIVEKTGRIRIFVNGALRAKPFLDLSGSVSRGGEQGLLGFAFHPKFTSNRKIYVDYTNRAGDTIIREYRVSASNPNVVSTSTSRRILKIDQPFSNHNGGMIAFGRDGYLYIGMGDGGSGGDPGNRAQDKTSLLGKILRINVNGSTATRNYLNPSTNPYVGKPGRNEIWERGLRNPWRFSFDRANGNLWIGDVGQNRYEEVDRAVRTSTGAGRGYNWGWRLMEGFRCYRPSSGCDRTGLRLPLLAYSHASNGRCAVTGGYVYRGSAIPTLIGGYVYGDYCSGEIFVVSSTASSPAAVTRLLDTSLLISSFGEDTTGEILVTDLNGSLYRIVAG